jgi:pyruvate ferredoxin oxidoreductase gamma subunit
MAVKLESPLVEIRWHGRGGQGVVTASRLLAEAALEEGLFFQSLPEFGAERAGAPLVAYSRISSSYIHNRSYVSQPDVVVVLDPTLIGAVNFLEGLKEDGIIVVNTHLPPGELAGRLEAKGYRVCTVDATRIALDTLGRNIPNVPLLGALVRSVPIVTREAAEKSIRHRLGLRLSEKTVEANLEAFRRGYQEAQLSWPWGEGGG